MSSMTLSASHLKDMVRAKFPSFESVSMHEVGEQTVSTTMAALIFMLFVAVNAAVVRGVLALPCWPKSEIQRVVQPSEEEVPLGSAAQDPVEVVVSNSDGGTTSNAKAEEADYACAKTEHLRIEEAALDDAIKEIRFLTYTGYGLSILLFLDIRYMWRELQSEVALVIIGAKALLYVAWQYHIASRVARQHKAGETMPLFGRPQGQPRDWWLKTAIWVPYALVDFADLDMDWLTALSATQLSWDTDDHFAKSWRVVPLIGDLVAWMGIGGMLVSLTLFATIAQLASFTWRLHAMERKLDEKDDRVDTYIEMQHLCDTTSVVLVAETFHEMAEHEIRSDPDCSGEGCSSTEKRKRAAFADRTAMFRYKFMCEASPTLFFSISVLQHSIRGSNQYREAPIAILTVFSSFVAAFRASGLELFGCYRAMQKGWKVCDGRGQVWSWTKGAWFRLTVWLLNLELLVVNIIRMWGVFLCADHTFNVTSWSCLAFDHSGDGAHDGA